MVRWGAHCLLVLLAAVMPLRAAVTAPGEIVARMRRFVEIQLCTSGDHLADNLLNPAYGGCGEECPAASDIYVDFLDGELVGTCWSGMPYAYGRSDTPDDDVQGMIDQGRALGNHRCHYVCRGCGYPGCDWSVGVDCSAAVCYALGIPRISTTGLDSDEVGVPCSLEALQPGSYLVKPGVHVMLVTDVGSHTVIEATGGWPVARETRLASFHTLLDAGYVPRTPVAVADAQASDGFLVVEDRGDGVHLTWHVDSNGHARWYEFQYYDAVGGLWRTFARREAAGPGDYTADHHTPAARKLIYRVWEYQWDGRRIPHGEARARPRG